jgi:hypothetical protein
MVLAHAFGASIVEGLITGLGVAYLQRRHPEYLTSLRRIFAPEASADGAASRRPLWQVAAAAVAVAALVLAVVGLIEGKGDPSRMFGTDWTRMDWASVASMLVVTTLIGAVLLPLTYLLLPRRAKRVGTAFAALAVISPLGLIAPGFAYGEGSATDVQAAFGYVPQGLRDLSGVFSAPLSGYNLPFLASDAHAPLWHAAVGYEVAGIVGMLVVGGAVYAMARLLRRGVATPDGNAGAAEGVRS